eukprot:615419_1
MNLKYILAFFAIGVNVVLSDISHIRGAPSDEELEIIENNDLQGLELEEAPFQEEQLDLDVIHGRELGSKDGDKGSGGRRRNRPGKRPGKKRRRRRRRKHHSHKRKSGSRRRRKSRSRSRRRKSRSHYRRRRGRKYRRRRYYRRRSRKSTSSSSSSSRSYYPRSYYVTTRRNDGVMCVDFGDEFGWQTVGVEGEDMYWWMLNRANPKAIRKQCTCRLLDSYHIADSNSSSNTFLDSW